MASPEHNKKIAEYIIEAAYRPEDFIKELSLNETLKLFRGLFMYETQGSNPKIFTLYGQVVKLLEEKLNVSTWLTVIETCRNAGDGLAPLLILSKKRFTEIYD